MNEEKKTYPKGHIPRVWITIGMVIFSGFGVTLSLATDNPGFIGIGPALGVGFGLSIGQSIEDKYKQEGRICNLNDNERKSKMKRITLDL